ncbi:hypothetical protein [Kribbella sp. NPDC051718]
MRRRGVPLRGVFSVADGTDDDWDTYGRAMREGRRVEASASAIRIYSNPA